MRPWLLALLIALPLSVIAQEFKPFAKARITPEQWQSYFEEVVRAHAKDRKDLSDQKLVLFVVDETGTNYAFTQEGHPAHPAWITRQLRTDETGVYVAQIGYFAGAEPPFARMFKEFRGLDDKMRHDFLKRHPAEK